MSVPEGLKDGDDVGFFLKEDQKVYFGKCKFSDPQYIEGDKVFLFDVLGMNQYILWDQVSWYVKIDKPEHEKVEG